MKEILFRGKRADNGEWVYGYVVKIKTDKTNEGWAIKDTLYHINDGCCDLIPEEVIPETIGQFIGLNDKTATAIFENDLVEKNGVVYKITWNGLHAMWGLFTKTGQSIEEIVCDTTDEKGNICKFWQDRTLTIIGNIHDNPEIRI